MQNKKCKFRNLLKHKMLGKLYLKENIHKNKNKNSNRN